MVDVQCPLPQAIDHDGARKAYDAIRKEMPGLSPAAWRREAARRMGTDYDTFLKAWKKPGPDVRPNPSPPPVGGTPRVPTPEPPKPPGTPGTGGGPALTREAARKVERDIAKELGLTPGSAAARKAAADRLGMRYDDFLAAWKGQKPAIPKGPNPDVVKPNTPPAPKVPSTPKPPTPPTMTRSAINKVLTKSGLKISSGGDSHSLGFDVKSRPGTNGIELYLRPGSMNASEAQAYLARAAKALDEQGYDVEDGVHSLHKRIFIKNLDAVQPSDVINAAGDLPHGARFVRSSQRGAATLRTDYAAGTPEHSRFMAYLDKLDEQGFDVVGFTTTRDYVVYRRSAFKAPASEVRAIKGAIGDDKVLSKFSTGARRYNSSHAIYDEAKKQMSYVGKSGSRLEKIQDASEDAIGNAASSEAGTLAYYRPGRYTMSLTKHMDDAAFSGRHAKMQRSGWFSRCGEAGHSHGARSTFAHEFGHFVDDVMPYADRLRIMEVIRKDMKVSRADWNKFFGSRSEVVAASSELITKARVSQYVSRYGSKDHAEMFAEIWAEYSRAGADARPHIKKWGSMIQEILEAVS